MKQSIIFDKNVAAYEAWYKKYPNVYNSELAAIKEQLLKLPENIKGVEIGVGTGRFAKPLGIKEGVEPSINMAKLASKRGVEVVKGYAENIPYKDLHFDFVLFVTICHFQNIKDAIKEAYRVLKPSGHILIGFIVKDKSIGKMYEEKRKDSTFFKYATFYTVDYITKILKETGFKNLDYNQTLFGNLNEINKVQIPKDGFDEGSFVVIKASKK
jgi:ubiquinone/menaquinone biosynthesis C-methylase UbiE